MKLKKTKRVKQLKGKDQATFNQLKRYANGSKKREPFLDQFKKTE